MGNQLALIKKDTVDVVAEKVRVFQERGEIHFPANYSPENAMKSAWLTLQSTTTKDGRPVLEVCTKDSIANSLLSMVVQGLNPDKKQIYFIPYGKQLTCQRSYFGTMAVTKRVTGAEDIFPEVVYEGDEFEYEIFRGKKKITKHTQSLANVNKDKIVAAYCIIIFDEEREYTEIMTIDEIKDAWSMSKMNPDKKDGTHQKFTQEMAKRSVINRTCKSYMNASDDGSLIMKHFRGSDDTVVEAEAEAEIEENANSEYIDVEAKADEEKPSNEKPESNEENGQEELDIEEPAGAPY